MAQLHVIKHFLDSYLEIDAFEDECLNGLQIESSTGAVKIAACAVDPGLDVVRTAADSGAQLLIVHHGLFWRSQPVLLCGATARKAEILFAKGCSLYASHLPLDAHQDVGNNAQLALLSGAQPTGSFCRIGEREIGIVAQFTTPLSPAQLTEKFAELLPESRSSGRYPLTLPFGTEKIQRIGIVSGSGSSALRECARLGLDALVSGEPKHEAYQLAKELKLNAMFFGHYATETLGVKAVCRVLEEKFGISTLFIQDDSRI